MAPRYEDVAPLYLERRTLSLRGFDRAGMIRKASVTAPGEADTGIRGLLEDEEIVEAVQKGVRSRFYTHGRYSVTREQGTHHFHSLIAEFITK